MNKKLTKGAAIALSIGAGILRFIAIVLVAAAIGWAVEDKSEAAEPEKPFDGKGLISEELLSRLTEIQDIIDEYYLFDQEDVDRDTAIIKGYVDALGDPYTQYYTPEEYKDLLESTSGRYSGIGVVVQQNASTGVITVVRPYENCPGWEAGMQPEDIIYKVAGEEVTGIDINLVVSKIKGEEGTTVDVTVYRPSAGEYIDMTVERRQIEVETITHEMKEDQIGYIEMTSFEDVTYNQFMDAFYDLKDQGMKALIVDIRDNGGGLLSSVVDILDELLPKGTITYTEDRDGKGEKYTSDAHTVLDIPMVVLVNGNSASASEIFTGAIQDYGVGTIVGTQTFGKGIVQVILNLEGGGAMKITYSRYFTPNGVCIHGEGITPDVVVEPDYESEEDVQLNEALRILKEQIQ